MKMKCDFKAGVWNKVYKMKKKKTKKKKKKKKKHMSLICPFFRC